MNNDRMHDPAEVHSRRLRPWMIPVIVIFILTAAALAYAGLSRPLADRVTPPLSGRRIAFAAYLNDKDGYEIYVMKADGSQPARLTWHRGADYQPAWSPDGRRIAFISVQRKDIPEIHLINADGSGETRLARNAVNPKWSPDGTQLAFATFQTGQIYVRNPDGSKPRLLTNDSQYHFNPLWSPDGTKIAYGTFVGDSGMEIRVVDTDGSHPQLIARADFLLQTFWSPDGTKILYTRLLDGTYVSGHAEIFEADADGSHERQLTRSPKISWFPTWSPNGRQIAFLTNRDGNNEIYVMDADGSNLKRLTDDPGQEGTPVWSPDGRQIAFKLEQDGKVAIYVMNTDGSNLLRLSRPGSQDDFIAWSPE